MPYSRAYESYFTNQEGQDVHIVIYDTTSFTTAAVDTYISEMNPSGDPLHIAIVDNDEDKFTPVRAKEATIKILTDNNVNLSLFAADNVDNRWYVVIYINTSDNVVFKGFLVLDDVQCPFLDNFINNEFTLTATDGLGLLKEIPMVKPDGTNPKGEFRVIDYISWCLQATGLKLQINVMWNLMEEGLQGLPAFNNVYINAKTFEGDINQNKYVANTQNIYNIIGNSINCYDVLTRLLGEEAYITQWKGAWWIRRIDEYEANPLYYDQYTYDGTYMSTIQNQFINKEVQANGTIQLITPATNVVPQRAFSFIKESFSLEPPQEIIDNQNFTRGAMLTPITPSLYPFVQKFNSLSTFPSPGDVSVYYQANNTGLFYKWNGIQYQQLAGDEIPNGHAYTIEDWTLVNLNLANPTPTATAFIERIFQTGYEKERYVSFVGRIDNNAIRSNRVDVSYKDKFTISVDRRITRNLTGTGPYASAYFIIRLYGDNGTYWLLSNGTQAGDTPVWLQSNVQFTQNNTNGFVYAFFDKSQSLIDWISGSVEAPAIPASGQIEIYLPQSHDVSGADTHFANLQFDYKPFINGSYQKYNAFYNKVYQLGTFKANRDKQVYISDAPRKLFKGALKKLVGGKYQLCGRWYNGAVPFIRSQNPVDPQYLHPLGFIQAYSVWNQYRRVIKHLDANLLGLESGTELPDLMHTYYFQDISPLTINKLYILIHYDQDLYRCEWKGYFAEIHDIVLGKKYSDSLEFKYIESN